MKNKILVLSLSSILFMSLNTIASTIVSDKINSEHTNQHYSGLGQNSSRKAGYSTNRKNISTHNSKKNSGHDTSKRTSGTTHKADKRHDIRREEKRKRVRKERERLKKEDIKNNPLSPYKR